MIISRTPFRISFFGGGTDYPTWFRQHGGAVLAATIDKYCYLTVRYLPPFFEHKYRVVYSKIEMGERIDEIGHPAVREILRYLDIERGVEVHHQGDLPARSGMGSSSAFAVGLLQSLYALLGKMPTKHQLALEAIHAEQNLLKETVGSQDQVSAAYGGLNHITFLPNGDFAVRPMTLPAARVRELESHLMLFYSGVKRTASDVAESYVATLDEKRRQLRILRDLVEEGVSVLNSSRDIRGFGELLHEAWQVKRSLSEKVSNSMVEDIYSRSREAGALGGKLLGAGGGGFFLAFVPPDRQEDVRNALDTLIHVPFQFEYGGSQIIFYDRETDYDEAESLRSKQQIGAFRELIDAATAGRAS